MSTDEEFDRLVDVLRETPRPDPAVRARHLSRAADAFSARAAQGTPAPVRHGSDRRPGRRARGVFMTHPFSPFRRGGTLLAGTALVAGMIVVVSPQGRDLWQRYGAGGSAGPTVEAARQAIAPSPATPADAPSHARASEPPPKGNPTVVARSEAVPPAPRFPAAASSGSAPSVVPSAPAPAAPGEGIVAAAPIPPRTEPAARFQDRTFGAQVAQSFSPDAAARMPAGLAPLPDFPVAQEADTEVYANAADNPVRVTAEDPVSTFSIDVDTASWGVVRQSLGAGQLPPADAVRVEEMINYFPYAYPSPAAGGVFRADVAVFPTPWNAQTLMARIGIQGEMPATDRTEPLNLVFLIDTSGSMQDPAKLPLLIASLKLMLPQLHADDEVAVVTYAGTAGVALPPTRAGERETIAAALDRLSAEGSTDGEGGLREAYAVARRMRAPGEIARVILATDGDFNVGLSRTDDLVAYIARQRESGVDLSVLGFGRGNLDDATMQALAQNGNGQAAYIDTLSEARKVLVDQLSGTLFTIARDVKIQVEWNPAAVAEWRLVGYETRALARQDFANDKVDAGELGAGTQVTALYELTLVGSPARLTEPLRYGQSERPDVAGERQADELGFLRLRWKAPGSSESLLAETPIMAGTEEADADARFAAAIAGLGQLLRRSTHLGDWGYADAIALADGARGDDPFGYRAEAVRLMRIAEGLLR